MILRGKITEVRPAQSRSPRGEVKNVKACTIVEVCGDPEHEYPNALTFNYADDALIKVGDIGTVEVRTDVYINNQGEKKNKCYGRNWKCETPAAL